MVDEFHGRIWNGHPPKSTLWFTRTIRDGATHTVDYTEAWPVKRGVPVPRDDLARPGHDDSGAPPPVHLNEKMLPNCDTA